VVRELSFERALERSEADGLLLVVHVNARSEVGNRAMDDATWIEGRALAVQIDAETDTELARALNVRAVPTTIVFRGGRQIERVVGFQTAIAMTKWLDAVAEREARPDPYLRESSASMALADQRYDEATAGYAWLWSNIPGFEDAGWMGATRFILEPLGALASNHPPAHEAFSVLRDASGAAATAFDLAGWFGPRVDWLLLNQVLGQQDRTLEWFAGIKADPRFAAVIEHCARWLFEPLKESQRWADIGRLFPNPLAALAELYYRESFGAPPSLALGHRLAKRFRDDASVLYSGLRAIGRTAEAKAVREEALRRDPSDEMRRAFEQAPGSLN
jgi:hypothetical protein